MNTVLNVKIDPKLKQQAQQAAKDLGVPMSLVVTAGLRQFIETRSITITAPLELSPESAQKLREMRADAKLGRNISPPFTDLTEARKWAES